MSEEGRAMPDDSLDLDELERQLARAAPEAIWEYRREEMAAMVAEVRRLRAHAAAWERQRIEAKVSAVCVWCEERFNAPGVEAKAAILAHIRVWEWHPMRSLERRVALLEPLCQCGHPWGRHPREATLPCRDCGCQEYQRGE